MAKTDSANRDIATAIHPYTNLKLHETEGPLVITEGDGVFVRDEDGKTLSRRARRACGASAWDFPSGVWRRRRIGRCSSCPIITPSRIKRPISASNSPKNC